MPQISGCLLLGALLAALCGSAAAEPRSCGLSFSADAAVQRRWPALLRETQAALSNRPELDACARIELSVAGEGITLEVLLADGRSAVRSGLRAVDVVPTLEALLGVPTSSEALLGGSTQPDAALEPATTTEPRPLDSATAPRDPRPEATAAPLSPEPSLTGEPSRFPAGTNVPSLRDSGGSRIQSGLGLELGAVTSARVGMSDYSSLSLGLLGLVNASRWLVGFQGRVTEYAWNPSPEYGDSFGTLELGALGGRRFELGTWALDVLAGPALSLEAGSTNVSGHAGPASGRSEESTTFVVPRVILASHLTWNSRSALRGFVGFEGEAGFAADSAEHQLPPWMFGVAVGAVVGQP